MKSKITDWPRKYELDELNFVALVVAIAVGPLVALLVKASDNIYVELAGVITLCFYFMLFLEETFTTSIPLFKSVQLWDWVSPKLTYSRKERIVLILSMILYWILSTIISIWL